MADTNCCSNTRDPRLRKSDESNNNSHLSSSPPYSSKQKQNDQSFDEDSKPGREQKFLHECLVCGKSFKTRGDLYYHLKTEKHKVVNRKKTRFVRCLRCREVFRSWNELQAHIKRLNHAFSRSRARQRRERTVSSDDSDHESGSRGRVVSRRVLIDYTERSLRSPPRNKRRHRESSSESSRSRSDCERRKQRNVVFRDDRSHPGTPAKKKKKNSKQETPEKIIPLHLDTTLSDPRSVKKRSWFMPKRIPVYRAETPEYYSNFPAGFSVPWKLVALDRPFIDQKQNHAKQEIPNEETITSEPAQPFVTEVLLRDPKSKEVEVDDLKAAVDLHEYRPVALDPKESEKQLWSPISEAEMESSEALEIPMPPAEEPGLPKSTLDPQEAQDEESRESGELSDEPLPLPEVEAGVTHLESMEEIRAEPIKSPEGSWGESCPDNQPQDEDSSTIEAVLEPSSLPLPSVEEMMAMLFSEPTESQKNQESQEEMSYAYTVDGAIDNCPECDDDLNNSHLLTVYLKTKEVKIECLGCGIITFMKNAYNCRE